MHCGSRPARRREDAGRTEGEPGPLPHSGGAGRSRAHTPHPRGRGGRGARPAGGRSYLPGLAAVGEGVDSLRADVHGAPVDVAEGAGSGVVPGAAPRRRRRRAEQGAEQSPRGRDCPPGHGLLPAHPAGRPDCVSPAGRAARRFICGLNK